MGNVDFWRNPDIAARYAAIDADPVRNWYERQVNDPSVIALLPPGAQRILDAGCGPGNSTAVFARQFTTVHGCDASEPMLTAAAQAHPDIPLFKWDFGQQPPEGMGLYDTVICQQVLEYVDDLDVFARAARSLLTPNGSLVISVWHPSQTAAYAPNYWQTTRFDTPVSDYGIYPSPIHRSQEELLRPFVTAGFVVRRLVEPVPTAQQLTDYAAPEVFANQPIRLNILLGLASTVVPPPRVGGPSLQQRLLRA